jgi:hypothetical protein
VYVDPASTRVIDVTHPALGRRRLRQRRWVLFYLAPPAALVAAAASYAAVGRHLRAGLGLVVEICAAGLVLGLFVLAARPGRDPTFSAWRARVLGARRRAARVVLLLAAPAGALLAMWMMTIAGPEIALLLGAMGLWSWLLTAPLLPLLGRLWMRAATSPAADALRWDSRPPVVYLRSFAADHSRLSGSVSGYAFEEAIVQGLWMHGPVVAAAQPIRTRRGEPQETMRDGQRVLEYRHGERVTLWRSLPIAPEGAARSWLTSQDWQRTVLGWLEQAQLVVVLVGGTQGLAWELDHVSRLGLQARVIALIPPYWRHPSSPWGQNMRSGTLAAQWQWLWRMLTVPGGAGLPWVIDAKTTLAVVPGVGDPPTVVVSRNARREDYELAVEAAAATIGARGQGSPPRSAPPSPPSSPSPACSPAAPAAMPGAISNGPQGDRPQPPPPVTKGRLSPNQHLLGWAGRRALDGSATWHLACILTLLFCTVVSFVIAGLTYQQIKAAGMETTAQGRRVLTWCRVYMGLGVGYLLLHFALLT